MMRGGHHGRAAREQGVNDGLAQRRAFVRVGAGADFVRQRQGSRPGGLDHGPQVTHVRGKRAEAVFDALRVADIGHHPLEHGHPRSRFRGHVQSAGGHQVQQAHRLQGHGLTAGVRAGNHQRSRLDAVEMYVDWHRLLQQRVAGRPQIE